MNLPPILPEYTVAYSNLRNFCCLARSVFGRFWSIISQAPHQLYQLVLSIKSISERCLGSDSSREQRAEEMSSPLIGPICLPRWKRLRYQDDPLNLLDCNLHGICTSPRHSKKPEDHLDKLEDLEELDEGTDLLVNDNLVFNSDHDPLDKMGAIPLLDPENPPSPKIISQQDVEKEILRVIQDMVQPAKNLLNDLEKKKGLNWLAILELLEKVDQELEILKPFTSKFEKIPTGHHLVQDTKKALENTRRILEVELCTQIKRQYRANYSIKRDGHCLFWSIGDLLDKSAQPMHYRTLAADYIRQHHQEFAIGVADAAKTRLGRAKINEYVQTQGGRQAWFEKLEKKLGRRPNHVDLYCDCLENSNIWGGINEVIALCEQLEVPILIFTRQDQKTWRFDMKKGLPKFKDKAPLLLYYNGINHYQSLLPVRKQAKN